jgi:hypothetical protein
MTLDLDMEKTLNGPGAVREGEVPSRHPETWLAYLRQHGRDIFLQADDAWPSEAFTGRQTLLQDVEVEWPHEETGEGTYVPVEDEDTLVVTAYGSWRLYFVEDYREDVDQPSTYWHFCRCHQHIDDRERAFPCEDAPDDAGTFSARQRERRL